MGPTSLVEFFKSIMVWPQSETELGAVAEKIRGLMGASFVAIYVPALGIKSVGPIAAESVLDFLREQVAEMEATQPWQIRQVRMTRVPLEHLLLIRISQKGRFEAGAPEHRVQKIFGWIAIDIGKAPSARDEVLLEAIAERLGNVASSSELEAMVGIRDQFLSIASHELKTPLTSIYGMVQLQERLLRNKRDDLTDQDYKVERDKQYSYIKIVLRQLQRLNEMIDVLLDVSRIQNGRFMVESTETDVAAVAREAIHSRMDVIAQETGVRIQAEIPETLFAWVDPVRFEEVLTNLVMNAIRFSPEGGVVWAKLKEDGESVRFTVRDQGMSVPSQDRDRIFQPFERAKSAVRLGGLGLGLFISRQIAQLHGGDVVLALNQPGHGNIFEARFPIKFAQRLSA